MVRPPDSTGGDVPDRIEVRPPAPDDDEQVSLVVEATEATFLHLKGFKLRVPRSATRSVTIRVARGGLLGAATVVAFNLLPGQHAMVLLVAVFISPVVIVGPGVLPKSIRRRAR